MGKNLVGDGEVLTPSNPARGDFENDPRPLPDTTPSPRFSNRGREILIDPSPPKEIFMGTVAGAATPARDPGTIGGVGGSIPPVTHACVGCGFCCAKAPCPYSINRYCMTHPCPGLYWNGAQYRCAHVDDQTLRGCVAIGAGCCSPLNTWRGSKIERRPEIENPLPRHRMIAICDTL